MIYGIIPDIYTICDVTISYVEKEFLNNQWIDVEPHFLFKTNMALSTHGNKFINNNSISDNFSNELLAMNRVLNDYRIEYFFEKVKNVKKGRINWNPEIEIINDFNEIIKFFKK